MPKAMKNISGNRYGRLLVKDEFIRLGKLKRIHWLCICDCGKEKYITTVTLSSGATKSCGCLISDEKRLYIRSKRSWSNTGVKGVYRNKNGTFDAKIGFNYKTIGLGNHETLEQGQRARIQGELKYFGKKD